MAEQNEDGVAPVRHGQAYPGAPAYPVYQPGQLPYQQYEPQVYRSGRRGPYFGAVPPGVRYHRIARTARLRWWHLPVGTLGILVAGFMTVAALTVAVYVVWWASTGTEPELADGTGSDILFRNDTADLGAALGTIAAFLPIVLVAAVVIDRRRPGFLSSVAGRLRWRWLLMCVAPAIVTCAVSYALSVLVGSAIDDPDAEGTFVGWSAFIVPMLVVLILVPLQSAAEEYFFRGWLIQGIGAYTLETRRSRLARRLQPLFGTPWPAIVVSGAVFVAGHGYTGWGIVDIFGFAALSGWLTVRTGGLEASIAIHVANNLFAFGFSAAVGDLGLEQGSVPWQYVLTDLVPLIGYAAVVVWLARRKEVQVRTTAQPSSGSLPSQVSQESGSQPGTPSTAR